MAAGPTMERLAYTSLGSDANGITFTSISQSYTTLYVTGHLKSDATSDSGLYFTINDNSGNVYSMMGWYGASSRSYATSQSNYVDRFGMDNSGTTGSFRSFEFWFFNYTSTSSYKQWIGCEFGQSGNPSWFGGLFRSNSAITSLEFEAYLPYGRKVKTGSTMSLYGIAGA